MALLDIDLLEPEVLTRPSKKKGRGNRNQKSNQQQQPKQNGGNIQLKKISPLTNNQHATFKAYDAGKNLLLHGYAGTGKTFLSLYLALEEVLSGGYYKKVVIIRSAVPSRDMGFMPGNIKEKMKQYEEPYVQICAELFGRGDAYSILSQRGTIEFTTTSYLRGLTFNDAIVIVDECQNNNFGELNTIITRLGDNSRIIIAGDYRQNDLNKKYDESGLPNFMKIIHAMKSFADIEFEIEDIVRSGTVKEYIIMKEKLGL